MCSRPDAISCASSGRNLSRACRRFLTSSKLGLRGPRTRDRACSARFRVNVVHSPEQHKLKHLHTSIKCSIPFNNGVMECSQLKQQPPPRACSTAHRLNRPDSWDGLMLDRAAVGQLHPYPGEQNGNNCNRCHFVLLDKDESCLTAALSNTGRPNDLAYSTGELLNTPLIAGCLSSVMCNTA